ncbi:MAG: YegS/Rv2252/BmrU family lipid kinase [Oscillospiraceae bacterium]|nr:YegS/Rv2252/BmrU family lipid kinase [Oscillospiraceae bacterium]
MKYVFILNPAAGKNKKALNMIPNIQKLCKKHGLSYQIHISRSAEDITEFVRNCCLSGEQYRFYAFGGDGTLNNVINGCIYSPNTEVGVIPMGTGNDFIKNFDVDEKDFFDIEKQLFSTSVTIDAIKYNDKYCINICNMGFDANTAMDMPAFKKIPMVSNKMAYNLSIAYNVAKKLGRYMEVYADDKLLFKGDLLMCAVSNGISCGGGFYVTPKASVNDGLIDVSAVTPPHRIKLGMFVKHFSAGTQLDAPEMRKYVHFTRAKKVRVTAKKRFGLVNDGEGEYLRDVEFEIVPGCLKFIVPEK